MKRKLRSGSKILALLAALMLMLTACASDDGTSADGGDAETEAEDATDTGDDGAGDEDESDGGDESASGEGPIPLGMVVWREGPATSFGDLQLQGAELALEQVNSGTVPDVFEVDVDEGGGILGGRQLALTAYDEGYDATASQNATREAIDDGSVAIFGTSDATTCVAVKDAVAGMDDPLPLVITGCGTEKITEEGYPGAVHIRSPVEPVQSEDNALTVAARWILDQGYTNVQGVGLDSDFVKTTDSEFQRIFSDQAPDDFTYQGMILSPFGEDEVRVEVTKGVGSNPDLLYLGVFGQPVIVSAIQAAREAGYDGDILMNEAIWSQAEYDILGEAAEGVYGHGSWFYDPEVPESQAFRDAYFEAYEEEPHWFSQLGYTAVLLLAQAMQDAGTTDPGPVKDALYTAELRTPLGDQLNLRDDGMRVMKDWVFWQAQDGEMVVVDRIPFTTE